MTPVLAAVAPLLILLAMAGRAAAQTYYWNRNSLLTNDKDFSRSFNWTANQDGTGAYPTSEKDDDFSSGSLGAAWTPLDRDNEAGTGSNSVSGGQLTLSGSGADIWTTQKEYYTVYRTDLIGNFDISVKIVSQTNTDPWAKAGILVADSLSSLGAGGFHYLAITPSNGFSHGRDESGTIGEIDYSDESAAGAATYPCWIRLVKNGLTFSAYYKTAEGTAWTQLTTGKTSQSTSLASQVGLFVTSVNPPTAGTVVFDDFKGGGAISATGLSLSLNGTGANADANATFGSKDISAASLDMTGYAGTLNFGGANGLFATYYDNMDFTGTSFSQVDSTVNFNWSGGSPGGGLAATTWSAKWEGYVQPLYTETYTFYPSSDDGQRLWVNGQLLVDNWQNQGNTEKSATIALTAGVKYSIVYTYYNDGGGDEAYLRWSSTTQVKEVIPKRCLFAGQLTLTGTGTALNMAAGTVTAADGTIEFSASSGTQTFIPRSAQTCPKILHSGAGTLQLSTNALTTLGFSQSAGTLDFNSLDITTAAGGTNRGDFAVWNGTSSSFTNLGGRTLTVVGHASFSGQSGNLLNMNPGSAWTLTVTGQQTADYATIGNCNANGTSGFKQAFYSTDGGGNSSWTFNGSTFYWNRNALISSTNGNATFNMSSNADGTGFRPLTAASDKFASTTLGAGWTVYNKNNTSGSGGMTLSGGQVSIASSGGDMYGGTNQFNSIYRTDITGDYFDVTVKVMGQTNTSAWAKSGILMANNVKDLTQGGYAYVAVTPGNGWDFQWDNGAPVGEIESGTNTGSVTFPCWIRLVRNGTSVSAYYKTSLTGAWTLIDVTPRTPSGLANGTNSQIAIFVSANNVGNTATAVYDDFEAGTNLSDANAALSFGGTGANADANATLSANATVASVDFTGYTGTFDFGSSTLTLNSGNATFVAGQGLTANAGTLEFTATSGTQTFTPKSGTLHPTILKSGAGTVTVATNALNCQAMTISAGTWNWGASTLTHTPASVNVVSGATMTFGTNTVQTTGAVYLSGTVNANTGTLAFSGTSGTQIFVPASGTSPNITHTGASTVQLSTNNLSCLSFSNSAGTLDLNGKNITTTSSGNFTITNGTSSTFTNLGGRTLTVAGNASFTGTSSVNLLNLNPTTAWTVDATGTLAASYSDIAMSSASRTTGVPANSVNGGGNSNWNFGATDFSAWNYNAKVVFNTTSTGANVSGNVDDFPLLVRLHSTNFTFTQAHSDGRDIRFRDPDGTSLPYHIERWDATNKRAEVWVRVPRIDGNSASDYITMYWGNSSASAASSGTGVFGDYKAVFHLNESPGAAAPQFTDASGNSNTGTAQGGATGDSLTAVSAKGFKLDGSSKYVTTTTSFANPSTFTASCWFKTVSKTGGKIFGFGESQTGLSTNYDRHVFMGTAGELNLGVNPSPQYHLASSSAYNDGAWHHAVVRMGSSGSFLYVDGAQVGTNASATAGQNFTGYWRAGYDKCDGWTNSPGNVFFNGSLDEFWVTQNLLTADFIKLAYQTQKPGSAVISIPNTDLSTWSYSTKVYINTTASGANITSNQSNYPMLVRLTAANFTFSQANSDGSDLRFADSSGNLLSYEIERFDATNKLAEIWVLIPTVYGNNSFQWFKMYWGKGTAASLSSGADVFLGSANFVGVWHLNEDGNTTSSGYRDASNAGNHGTGIGFDANTDLTAVVGKGSSFAAASNQGIHVAHNASLNPSSALTIQAWLYQYSQTSYKRIAGKPYTSEASPWNEYDLELDANGNKVAFSLNLGGTEGGVSTTTTMSTSTWYQAAGTYDGSNQKLYMNGVLEATSARSGTVTNYGQTFAIGKYAHSTGSNFDGILDEVRVSMVARSSEWMKLDYETMKTGSSVVTVGSRSKDYAKSVQFNFNTTATGANVSGNVSNIPILVRLTSSNFDFTAVRDDGADIRFIDKTGAALYHEVVEWDKGNKTGKVWVKVPQVDGNSTADFITAYYGCSTCSGNPYTISDSVWSAYAGVFHLKASESPSRDATRNGNHITYKAAAPSDPGLTTPLAPYFAAGTGNYADAADPTDGSLDVGTGDFSLGMWVKTSQSPAAGVWPYPVAKMGGSPAYGYDFFFSEGGANVGKVGFDLWSNGSNVNKWSSSALNDGAWHHVVGKKTATTVELYIDGVSQGTTSHAFGTLDNANTFAVGGNFSSMYLFAGNLNEVFLIKSALSADYVKLAYQNQKESSTLLSSPVTAASFSASKVYKFNTTSSGANVSGDVYDFPLLIRITGSTMVDAVQDNAPDIRFLDGDGVTWLDYQVARWNKTVDSAEVWVKVPKVDGNSTGDFITLYYNDVSDGAVPDGQCASCVFETGNSYAAVWHLDNSLSDATSNAITGSNTGSTDGAGMVGSGRNFDGTDDYISFGNPDAIKNISTSISVEFWMRTALQASTSTISVIRHNGHYTTLQYKGATDTTRTCRWIPGATNSNWGNFNANFADDAWHHVVVHYNGQGATKVWRDGASYASFSGTAGALATNATANFMLGATESGTEDWTGRLDEVRISSVVRDSNYIKLSYQTQRATPTLFNPSTVEFTSSTKLRFNTTRTGANVMGDVENFPLLVRLTGATIVDAVQDDWDDIRFLDADGKTWLKYSVERWSKTLDSAEVWVSIPRVDGNSDQDFITLYYNDVTNGAVANGECATCVFSTSNNFQAVWHLNNSVLTDATSNANNGTNTGSTDGAGVSGSGRNFDGTDDYITFGNGNSLKNIATAITVEAWVKTTLAGASTMYSVIRHDGHFTALQYGSSGSIAWTAIWNTSLNYPATWTWNGVWNDDAWHHYVTQYQSGSYKVWKDGALYASSTSQTGSLSTSATANFVIGAAEGGTEDWTGKLDEVRVSDTFRDSNYIKLSYETQRLSGNLFWNARPGPNNNSVLTATPGSGAISLAWTTPVSDSSNADSVGIWLKYSGPPDSVGATGQTKVVILPKTDSSYSYPATYPGNYYFALAVKNSSGNWSPFTRSSIDTVNQGGSSSMTDTIYVDSAIGSDGNSCTAARNPATPKLTIEGADDCDDGSANDTLVIRMMPGTYSGSLNDRIDSNNDPVVVTSFDVNSRAVFASAAGSYSYNSTTYYPTIFLFGGCYLRNMDVKAGVNNGVGVMTVSTEANIAIEGCRIYNNGATQHAYGIMLAGTTANYFHVANNIVHQPTTYGIWNTKDDIYNIVNNTVIGTGAGSTTGIYNSSAAAVANSTISNNILYNLDYGIRTVSNTAATGVLSNNLFYLVTNGRDLTNCTDTNKVSQDPKFYSVNVGDRNAFKLLPGSPAIDAGTTSTGGGYTRTTVKDFFGSSRPQSSTPDIGAYEGTGYTPNPTGEFDTLTNTVSGNTVIVKNGKWKLVWDMARGAGITGFYDMTVDSTANLVGTNSLLFDVKLDAFVASGATSNTLVPEFHQRTRTRSVVRQRLAVSASVDLIIWYTVYASGHIYVQSEVSNLSAGTLSNMAVGYSAKLGAASAATLSGGSTSGISFKNGYGFLTASTRDVLLSVTQDLDLGAAGSSETWSQAGSTAGTLDSVWIGTTDMADLAQSMKRQHHFLLYVGDGSLDQGKASTLNADAYSPSALDMSAGSLNHERSWQGQLTGHWTLDDGSGSTAKDKSIVNTNDATITSGTWISGKVKGALRFTTSSVASVADNDAFEAGQYRTVMFWVKPDFASMNSDAYILSKGLGTSDGWHFRRVTGASQIKFTMANVVLTSPTLTTNTWNHLAAVVDGSRYVKLYVNGVLVAASTSAATAAVNTNALRMGENGGSNGVDRFAGDIDDVRIYSTSINVADIQSVYRGGFAEQYGHYYLRADNNNRVVALLNGSAAATRMQPAFRIDNWYGTKTPKYVYLNGVRLLPNTDFVSDSIAPDPAFGSQLLLQVNKVLIGADQTLFVDDNDSTGYLGTAGKMKSLTMSATANDKFVLKNFADTVFGSATSGQWYMEVDLNGWSPTPAARLTDTGFGAVNVWKAAAVNPNVAISSASSLVGQHATAGKMLHQMKFDGTGNQMMDGALGYTSPANITYTITDSSSTRLSLVTTTMTSTAEGTVTFTKRWTFYPTGRIFGSINIATNNLALDAPLLYTNVKYQAATISGWSDATGLANGRMALLKGDPGNHAIGTALLSIKSAGATTTAPGSNLSAANASASNSSNNDYKRTELTMQTGLFQSVDVPITVNFMSDFSSNFTDSATADSLLKDSQNPATITALGSGSANPADDLDFNTSPDGFAEGDGAYVYTAGSGVAHFKFVNTVTHFNPAFRIKSWSFSTLPEFVIVDNQTLVKDYHYNAYVNFSTSELIIQFNKTFTPGTHLFFISHKTGLAVTLDSFEALPGEGVDTLKWSTQSEFENLGYHVWRRMAPVQDLPDSLFADREMSAGAGIANALMGEVRQEAAAAKYAKGATAAADSVLDTLPQLSYRPEDLKAMGYVRINARLIPGAKGGSSSTTQNYLFVDRTAAYGTTYEYLLESMDFAGMRVQYGPRKARPNNPLETVLHSNYPNPFNPITTLRFSLKEKAKVSLVIYDAKGRVVRILLRPDKAMLAGKYRLIWDARDDKGFDVPSGQYFYRFSAPKYVKTRKMILVK